MERKGQNSCQRPAFTSKSSRRHDVFFHLCSCPVPCHTRRLRGDRCRRKGKGSLCRTLFHDLPQASSSSISGVAAHVGVIIGRNAVHPTCLVLRDVDVLSKATDYKAAWRALSMHLALGWGFVEANLLPFALADSRAQAAPRRICCEHRLRRDRSVQ